MFVLDTDVLSLGGPTSRPDPARASAWQEWARRHQNDLYLSVITLMEVRFGIEKLEAKGASRKAGDLRRWLLATEVLHRARLLPVTADVAHRAGLLLHKAAQKGFAPSSEDALIAATADIHGFRLLSRNRKHMQPMGIESLDPLTDFR